jgi:lipoprotein-anchoring transpeptidase ErfK/SrfK
MTAILSRRAILAGAGALLATAPIALAQEPAAYYEGPEFERDLSLIPPAESPIDYPVEKVNLRKIPAQYHRQLVDYQTAEWPGTLVIDPEHRFLYHVREGGKAIRYGVGVGREGFSWHGEATVGLKRRWPRWLPPEEMVLRDENAAKWANGMPGGPENPLGARALYLYANGQDTLFRIHGTNEPKSIGKAMSSGCIRMLNQDVADLYLQVPKGSRVVVLPSGFA